MKHILFSFTLLLAVVILSGNKPSGKNVPTEKTAKVTDLKDINSSGKPDAGTSKTNNESIAKEKTPAGKPRILLMLNNDSGQSAWSPFLWWNYEHVKPAQIGC